MPLSSYGARSMVIADVEITDATAINDWLLFDATDTALQIQPLAVQIVMTDVAGFVSNCTISVGAEIPTFANIMPATLLTSFQLLQTQNYFATGGLMLSLANNNFRACKARISTAAVATRMKLHVYLLALLG